MTLLKSRWATGAALVAASLAYSTSQANEEVMKLASDPANWAMPTLSLIHI